eukprot:Gb_39895 [translate_table: standard]
MSVKMHHWLLCLILLLLSYSSLVKSHLNNVSDERALLSFKNSITSDPHNVLGNWNANITFCNWKGVKCSLRRQRVVALELTSMGLEGSISPLISNLSFIRVLAVSDNSLSGSIPHELGRLHRLRLLSLSRNELGDSIPTTLSGCRNLKVLSLSYNHLSGSIPSELGLLSSLNTLYLGTNGLTGTIPSSLANISSLNILDVSSTNLQGEIPDELGRLHRLNLLSLSNNKLGDSIPTTLSGCRNLRVLSLSYNHLSGRIPSELGLLSNLKSLYLGANRLTGTIPSSLANISSLNQLDVSGNNLQGEIPHELGTLSQLESLYVSRNHLTGTIPSSLLNISTLTELSLFTNNINGLLPSELGLLTNLQKLLVQENSLSGQIPTSLSNCTSLVALELANNRLKGHIPPELGSNLFNMDWLALMGNQLSGSIPNSLANCSRLTVLELSENQLSGTVPMDLGKLQLLEYLSVRANQLVSGSNTSLPILTALNNCSSLQELYLDSNNLTGVLPSTIDQLSANLSILCLNGNSIRGNMPPQIANLTTLTFLDLSSCLLDGGIPVALERLQNLERLFLDNNKFRGRIPREIGRLKSLGVLSLGLNMLSGPIPDTIGDLQQLRYLLLHDNQLSGNIPASLGNCFVLEMLDLFNNKLSGNIPPEVAALPNLQFYFNLSRNLLQGRVPLEIGKMEHVLQIDISLNKLSGHIPDTIGSCVQLQYLNLSRNALEGPIPRSLGQLKSLENMDLSSNNLSGIIPESLETLNFLHFLNFSFNNLTGKIPQRGAFANLTVASFMGNPGLCGKWIHLRACPLLTREKKHRQSQLRYKIIIPVTGVAAFVLGCVLVGFYWRCCCRRRILNPTALKIGYRRISYEELVNATDGFSEANLLGTGSFGSVYKGTLSDGTMAAIKVLNLQHGAASKSFKTECRILGKARHRNLVRIITSCSNLNFKALILKFMPKGNLENCLYGHSNASNGEDVCGLSFRERLNIAIDIAHGIEYLHHDCFMQIVHCDLKPSNVLLDDSMTGHVTDFGIARLTGANPMDSLTSTVGLKGSIGYIAPEYGLGGRVTTKGDVYSYGIVLLEILTRKRPTNDIFVGELNLHKWVHMALPNAILDVVDRSLLRDMINNGMEEHEIANCVTPLIHIALLCTKESPHERPTMRQVARALLNMRGSLLGSTCELPPTISALVGSTSAVTNAADTSDSSTV